MGTPQEHSAVTRFKSGLNCAQSVFAEFAVELGLTEEQAYKLASGFGGGLSHTNNICGAVTGGVLAIGLKYGASRGSDRYSKALTYRVIQRFMKEFTEAHGSLLCTSLLGYDLSDEEQFLAAIAAAAPICTCPKFLVAAVELVRKALDEGANPA